MIKSIRENRKVRSDRKDMRDRQDEYSYSRSAPLEFRDQMTEVEHRHHQQIWESKKRNTQMKLGLLVIGGVLFVVLFLLWLVNV